MHLRCLMIHRCLYVHICVHDKQVCEPFKLITQERFCWLALALVLQNKLLLSWLQLEASQKHETELKSENVLFFIRTWSGYEIL